MVDVLALDVYRTRCYFSFQLSATRSIESGLAHYHSFQASHVAFFGGDFEIAVDDAAIQELDK